MSPADAVAQARVVGEPVMTQNHILTAILVTAGAFAVGSPTLTEYLPSPTDPWRIYLVPAESRAYSVPSEDRGYIVPDEDRTTEVKR